MDTTQKLTIEQFGQTIKQKYPAYASYSDAEVGQKMLEKYPQYQDKIQTAPFNVPEMKSTETPEQKAARIAASDAEIQKKSKRTSSALGILGNTIKGVGETVASAEVALGKTMGKIASKGTLDTYTKNIDTLTNSQLQTIKLIKQYEAEKKDTTTLKQIYNDTAKRITENKKAIGDYSESLPTIAEALGQLGGVALDVLTAGSYKGIGSEAKAVVKSKSLIPALANPEAFTVVKKPAITAVANTTSKLGKVMKGAEDVASTIAPEATKVVETASKPTGIGTLKGIGNVAKGAGVGYASDVTQGLQGARGEDRKGAKAFIPGLGTAIGAGLPAVTETIQSFKNQFGADTKIQRVTQGRRKELDKLDSYATLDKVTQKAKDKGFDVKEFVANSDLLDASVDKTGTISTKGEGQAVEKVQNFINKNGEDVVNKILEKEGVSIDPSALESELKKSVMSSGLQGSNLTKALREVESDMAGYAMRADKDGRIPLTVIHNAKVDKYSNINFMTDPSTQKTAKVIAKKLKELVETNTNSADVKALNKELSQYYTVIDYLEKLDGKKVDGGKLGKYFAKTVGAMVGGHFGPLGAIIGAETAGGIKGSNLSKTLNGKTGVELKSSQMMKDAIAESNKPRLMIAAPQKGAPRSVSVSSSVIPVAPKNSSIELTSKLGIGKYKP